MSMAYGRAGAARCAAGWIGGVSDGANHSAVVDAALDAIAARLEQHLDIDGLLALAREAGDA
jgi:adenosylcobyric acid synthase